METENFSYCHKELEIQTFFVFAALLDKIFVGYIFLNYLPKIGPAYNKGWLFVDDLWVNPFYRRKGIGHALLKRAGNLSKELNTLGLRLYVNTENPDGIALYEAFGFEQKFGLCKLMQKEG